MAPTVPTRGARRAEAPAARAPGESVSDGAAHRSAGPAGTTGTPVRDPEAAALPPAISCRLALPADDPADPPRAPGSPRLPKAVPARAEAAARAAGPGSIDPGGRQASQDAVGSPLPIPRHR